MLLFEFEVGDKHTVVVAETSRLIGIISVSEKSSIVVTL